MELNIGDTVKLKKAHPCGGNCFQIVRTGADYKIECLTCGRILLAEKDKLIKMIKEKI